MLSAPDVEKGSIVEEAEQEDVAAGEEAAEEEKGEPDTCSDPWATHVRDVRIETSGRLIDI